MIGKNKRRVIIALALVVSFAIGRLAIAANDYFPPNAFDVPASPEAHKMFVDWYSKHLAALKEKPLFGSQPARPVYRFTWLRSFHKPMAFRLTVLDSGEIELVTKRADGKGGYEPGNLDHTSTVVINRTRSLALLKQLEDMGFWTLQTHGDSSGLDGARWVLEGAHANKYHVVNRWSPRAGELSEWCLEVMKLSGVELGNVY